MATLTSQELRQKYLDFMASKGHAVLPSASLVPKEDPTVLFTTAGMQPIIPYLTGQAHPQGDRLTNSQKCLRTADIEEVGDNRHLTFFEMLGNWSLGAYFKAEIIRWTFEFLTAPEWLGLDPQRLYVTVYKGSELVAADTEAVEIWRELFTKVGLVPTVGEEFDFAVADENEISDSPAKLIPRIMLRSGKDNWWGLPYKGPCGPCSEVYYLLNEHETDLEKNLAGFTYAQVEDFLENQIVEIWNNVFMMYEGEKNAHSEPAYVTELSQKNIDTGAGFERILTVLNGYQTPYETDVLKPLVEVVERYAAKS